MFFWLISWAMGIYGDFMVISTDAMGFYNDLMGITVSVYLLLN